MGFYQRVLFPRFCDWTMRGTRLGTLRGELLAPAAGEILEIGFGTGLNLGHYPPNVRRLTAIDPGPGMERIARRRIARSPIQVDLRALPAEALPFEDGRFQCVVSTWTLCSVRDVAQALSSIARVLSPGGHLLFLEHGLSQDPVIGRWQRRLSGLQQRLADGCRLDLDLETRLQQAPFRHLRVERFQFAAVPRVYGSMYRGCAVK